MKIRRNWFLRKTSRSLKRTILLLIPSLIVISFLIIRFITVKELSDWGPESDRKTDTYIQPYKQSALVFPNTRILAKGEEMDLLGIIHSNPTHFEHRDVIRKTWLKDLKRSSYGPSFKVVFLIGISAVDDYSKSRIDSEIDAYGDIIIENFVDTYNNLTLKSILMLKFVIQYELKTKFLFKMDDDIYLNVERYPKLIDLESKSLGGFKFANSSPIRTSTIFSIDKKWLCPKWMFEDDVFPQYLAGAGYLIPGPLVPQLYRSAFEIPFIHLEDVFITGILAEMNNLPREDIVSFLDRTGNDCTDDHSKLLYHPMNPDKMLHMHYFLKKGYSYRCKWM